MEVASGRTLLKVVMVVALVATAIVVRSGPQAGADVSPADPYTVQPAVDADPAPNVFETTLVARPATVDIGNGVTAEMWTYNGTVPGPEIRARVGDTLVVHFRNELPLPSSIHWHGIELNNASDGTELTQDTVPPGGTFLYRFVVPRPGIFWYHPHHHPTNQVFRGLYGSLIVTDHADDTLVAEGVLPSREHTRTLMLSDTTVCKEPGRNDTDTYDDSLPWVEGPLPEQPSPFPSDLCDRPMDDHGHPVVDQDGRPAPLPAGEVPNIQRRPPERTQAGRTNEGQTVLANGRNWGGRGGSPDAPGALAPGAVTVDVAAGQGLRLQVTNAATTRYFRLRLTDGAGNKIDLVRVGGQGGLLDNARLEGGVVTGPGGIILSDTRYDEGEIVLGAAERADVVVVLPPDAPRGVATLWTLDFEHIGGGFALVPTVPVMHLNITPPTGTTYTIGEGAPLRTHPSVADPVERLGPPREGLFPDTTGISPLLDPATFSPPKPGSASEEIRLTVHDDRPRVDDEVGNHGPRADYRTVPHTASTRYARLGDLLELTVANITNAHHPFHLHGFSFQPVSLTRTGSLSVVSETSFDYHEFVDTFNIPSTHTLRFRVRLDDRPQMDGVTPGGGIGRWVFHCHIFFHATMGMHAELVVLAPDGNEKPFVNADHPRVEAAQDGAASATGTFGDPDGDPVELTASTGTVSDVGGGGWTWSPPPGGLPAGRRTVYVTAVDGRGFSAQAGFELRVENVAPALTVTAPPDGSSYAVGSTVTVAASITDPGPDHLSCRFDWDDGAGPGTPLPAIDGTCRDTRAMAVPGVYTVRITGADGEGGADAADIVIPVYDPHGGFVTGSGATASGEATFDLSVRYLKGLPVGHIAFTHAAAGLDFAAAGFDWLVVAGARAQVKGPGTVGGAGGYRFLLSVVDGAPDRLRLKVWHTGTAQVVYDNAPGGSDDIDMFDPPPVSHGSVVIHR